MRRRHPDRPVLDPARPKVPDVLPRVRAYMARAGNGVGGSLYPFLDGANVDDAGIQSCIEWAEERRDEEGMAIATDLLRMTRTQRLKILGLALAPPQASSSTISD